MKELFSNLKTTWIYCKDQKGRLIKYIIFNLLMVVISVIVPLISARIIIDLTENNFYQLILICIAIFIINIINNILNYCCKKVSQIIYRETFIKIQSALGKEILKLENKVIDEEGTGTFIQRLTNDTTKLADIFNVLNSYLSNIISNIGTFVVIFVINKIIFLYLLLMIVILYVLEVKRANKYNEKDKMFRKKYDKLSSFAGELVRGIRDIKMLNAEDSFMNELDYKLTELNEERYQMTNVDRKYRLVSDFVRSLMKLLLIVLFVILIVDNKLEVANALIIYNCYGRLPSIINYVGLLLDRVKDFNLSCSRIFDIINNDGFKKEVFGDKRLDKVNGDFEFRNVSFGYNDELILKDLSFKVHANETVAFVGKSGAGKTTIFNLICKMYDTNTGEILIDGVNIKELDKDSIRGNITIISQNPYIFNLSIKDNLKLVKDDLTDEEMYDACKLACLDDFIDSLPDKYDTMIGEGGINLSGGQKQRLAIARALIQKTEIILFDEATSALDNETQARIQEAINNMKNEYTILIIAHRLSTIVNCDRILFLNNGKVEDEGDHITLLNTNEEYKKLYELELKKE